MTCTGERGLTLAPSPSPLTSVRAARRDGAERREARVEGRALVAHVVGRQARRRTWLGLGLGLGLG